MKYLLLIIFSLFFTFPLFAQQRIKDFYLSNFNTEGSKDWEIKGQEANINDNQVDIEKMDGKYFTADDTVTIKSERASLDKKNSVLTLMENVEIESQEGVKVSTDSLNWNRNENKIQTEDWVTTKKDDMQITAKGLNADTEFKNVDFGEDVRVKLQTASDKGFITINCDGPLEMEYNAGKATFNNNVIIEDREGKLFSDTAEAFFDLDNKKLLKIVAEGNVRIVKDENVTFAKKATYLGLEGKVILEGSPRIIYLPKNDERSVVPW